MDASQQQLRKKKKNRRSTKEIKRYNAIRRAVAELKVQRPEAVTGLPSPSVEVSQADIQKPKLDINLRDPRVQAEMDRAVEELLLENK